MMLSLRKSKRDVVLGLIVVFTSLLAHVNTLNADGMPNGNSAQIVGEPSNERLENLLLEMGYTDIDVSDCVLQFRRKLPNQCPTDKPLSYWRRINLLNLDMNSITEVQDRETDGGKWYLFKVLPTRDYHSRSIGIVVFNGLIKEKYPDSGWPFRADKTTPRIRNEFYQEYPSSENMNWFILETCYGDSPGFDVDYHMSYDDQDMLSDFRSALIDYSKSKSCLQERLNN